MALYYLVPSSGGDAIGTFPAVVIGGIGAIFGAYFEFTYGSGAAAAAGAAAGYTIGYCKLAGDYVTNAAPASQVLYGVGWFITWIVGIYFAILAAIGAFFGAGAIWILMDVLNGVAQNHAAPH
jgi:hypothetical protein